MNVNCGSSVNVDWIKVYVIQSKSGIINFGASIKNWWLIFL